MVEGKGVQQRGMEKDHKNGKESSHSAHANGMNEKIEKKFELTKVESEWQRKYIAPRLTSCARKRTMRHSESNSPKL
jgi:hypothetical protein